MNSTVNKSGQNITSNFQKQLQAKNGAPQTQRSSHAHVGASSGMAGTTSTGRSSIRGHGPKMGHVSQHQSLFTGTNSQNSASIHNNSKQLISNVTARLISEHHGDAAVADLSLPLLFQAGKEANAWEAIWTNQNQLERDLISRSAQINC